ncbi:MAG: prepilin-type N-terminal cleavage/methylation domain-containing protein [Lentisphaerae bacterium]|nr:prepilin-type N-terminal cleavage/methylation domain-containing protein [Lentisphaerota bacterium]
MNPGLSTRRGVGFTLIELLVVVLILGIVTTVIAASIAGGIRVWDAARRFNATEAEALLGLRIVETDLRNTFLFYDVPFRAGPDEMSFPALVPDRAGDAYGAETDAARVRVGAALYRYDAMRRAVLRSERSYPESRAATARAEEILGEIDSFQLRYYSTEANEWIDAWTSPSNHPGAVEIEIVFAGEDAPPALTRTVVLPLARRHE